MAALPPLTWRSYSITWASCDFAAFSIAIEEPASSETRMTTFAPALEALVGLRALPLSVTVGVVDDVRDAVPS